MDIRRLQILRELGDRGSVVATAAAMKVTASAVSQQLKVLQEEVGVTLVEKAGRGVRLTEAGLAMAAAASDVSAAMERAQATVDGYRSGWQNQIRAAFFPSAAEMFLPGLMYRLQEIEGLHFEPAWRIPPWTASYDWRPTTTWCWRTASRAWRPLPGARSPCCPCWTSRWMWPVPAGHPLAELDALRPEDVVAYPWIGVPPGFPFEQVLRQIEARTGRLAKRTTRYADLRVMEAMVAAGHGLAIVPRFTSRKAQTARGFVMRPLEGIRACRSIVVLARSDVAERSSVHRVIGMLQQEAAAIASQQG